MIKDLDRFRKNVAGRKDILVDYVHQISPSGDFRKINDLDVILSSWSNILIIPRGTYLFDPSFGSNLYKYLFEPADDDTRSAIEEEIKYSLLAFDSRANISKIDVSYLPNRKGFIVTITVEYRKQVKDLKVAITEESYFNFIRQGTI